MSGPKTSTYTLTGEQLKNFNAQSRCLRDALACSKQINALINVLHKTSKGFANTDTYGSENTKVLEIKEQLEKCAVDINTCVSEVNSSISAISIPSTTIIISEEELSKRKAVKEKYKTALSKLKEVKKEADAISAENMKIKSIVADDAKSDIVCAFSKSITIPENQQPTPSLENKKNKLKEELNSLAFNKLPEKHKTEIKDALAKLEQITSKDFLQNFSALMVTPLIAKCISYINNLESFGEEYEEKNAKYKVLCKLMNITVKEIPFSKEAIFELDNEIAVLEKELDKETQDEYIEDVIDEVMQEMGYDLIGHKETVKKSGRRFKNELYTFNEGTAVNIRYDSAGQIAMELGGIDYSDRTPTDSETSKLCEDMQTFCTEFKEFEKRLAVRGIVCKKRISILPPTAEHAQIINAGDYNTKEKIETIKITNQKVVAKEKHLRKE